MRPLELEMELIGPFVKKTLIDFDRFGESSLFLITGKTGSGKSFIFDAMCYALYGATPSGREDNISSDYRRKGDRPYIRFKFQIGDRTYEIERTLPHIEASKKGGGTAERKETQTLTWLNPPEGVTKVLATKKTEVKERCEELLSLKLEQFSRVMLIPQGDFRELLKANTESREPLLRQLFQSSMYTNIATALEEMFKKSNGQYMDLKKETNILTDQLWEMMPEGAAATEGGPSLKAITVFRDGMMAELPEMKKKVDILSAEYESSRKRTAWMEQTIRSHKDLEGSIASRGLLRSISKERIEPMRSRLERHDLAMELRPLIERLEDREKSIQRTGTVLLELDGEMARRRKVLEERKLEERKIPGLKERYERILGKEGRIEDLLSDLARVRESNKKLMDANKERSKMVDAKKGLQMMHDRTIERIGRLNARIAELGQSIVDIQKAEASKTVGMHLVTVMKGIDSLEPEIDEVKKHIKAGKNRVAFLERSLKKKRAHRELSLSAELSLSLEKGRPCPVCGSKDHPSPAKQSKGSVSRDDLERAEKDLQEEREELERLLLKGSELETRSNDLTIRAHQMVKEHREFKGMDVPTLIKRIESIKESIDAEKKRTAELTDLQNSSLKINEQMRTVLERKGQMSASLKEVETDIRAMTSDLESISKRIEDTKGTISDLIAIDDEAALASGLKDLQKEKIELPGRIDDILNGLKEAERNVNSTEDRIRSQKVDLASIQSEREGLERDLSRTLLEERFSIFKDQGEVKDSMLQPERLAEMKKEIDGHMESVTKLEGMIVQIRKDLEGLLGGRAVPSEEDLQKQMKEENIKKSLREEANSRFSRKERDLEEIDKGLSRIGMVAKEMADIEPRLAILRDLSVQVRGNAFPRISLERFFLAQRFEEVLIESNHRLQKLSENRFVLKRAREEEAGAKSRAGLDLLVFDNFTGQERPANTLSGGQMFLASLALALGLADVVQARSGGIKMEALFIDEGFGSLDEDALQIALKVLSELRKGRTVGVISHVQELKKQIPFQIEVLSSREGSTIEIRT